MRGDPNEVIWPKFSLVMSTAGRSEHLAREQAEDRRNLPILSRPRFLFKQGIPVENSYAFHHVLAGIRSR
jgi:hypothetical protein